MFFSIKRHFLITIMLLIAVSLLFFYRPYLDIKLAHYFFLKNAFHKRPLVSFSTQFVAWAVISTCITMSIVLCVALIKRKKNTAIAALFILLCFGLGPGFLVNGILKAEWGRPRPNQTQYVDATAIQPYVHVWQISDECRDNCSFVAGDSSAALTFIAFAFLPMRRQWRQAVVILSIGYFAYNGAMRVVSGAHYLSDVLIGGLLIYLVILGCYQLCYGYIRAC